MLEGRHEIDHLKIGQILQDLMPDQSHALLDA
jgi:hypothetical protein